MKIKYLLLSALMAVLVLSSTAVVSQESDGERNTVLTCFYECKDGPLPTYWVKVTSLMLLNPANRGMTANIVMLDGNENMLAQATTQLSPEDIDEVNICRTLEAAGIVPPSAGMLEILIDDPTGSQVGGTYGWVKNVVGKFFKTVNEPFQGRVTGTGKTECRVVPPSVTTVAEIEAKLAVQNPPVLSPILIEGTDP